MRWSIGCQKMRGCPECLTQGDYQQRTLEVSCVDAGRRAGREGEGRERKREVGEKERECVG